MLGKSFPSRVLSLPFCGTLGRLMISSFVVVSPHLGAIWSVLPHLHGGTCPTGEPQLSRISTGGPRA